MSFKADYVIQHAKILTMDRNNPRASAMAIWKDKIVAVGNESDIASLVGPDTKIWNLNGKCVMPGLNDSHGHLMYYAYGLAKVDCTGVTSIQEMLDRLRARAAETAPGTWVEGFGYDEMQMVEQREPTLQELDEAIPNHPLYLARACRHVALANSLGLKAAGYDENTPNPVHGELVRDESGRLTGRLCEDAAAPLRDNMPPIPADDMVKYIEKMSQYYNSLGITSATDMGMLGDYPESTSVWSRATSGGELKVRTSSYLIWNSYTQIANTGVYLPLGNDMFRYAGRKLVLDGSGGGGTARMREPNCHDGKMGILYYTQEELNDMVWEAHRKGEQICTHAIGDAAIEMVLDAYQAAQKKLPNPKARHRIEHCSFCFPDLIERVVSEHVYPSMHPSFLWYFGEAHLRNFGEERLAGEFPFRSLLDRGVIVGNGSDSPVVDPDPRPIIYATVTRKSAKGLVCGEKERISMEEALWTYTMGGAYLSFEEDKKGSLEVGKYADFIVTDIDPTEHEPEAILSMKVECTVLGGAVVFEAGSSQ